jgi:hypothetical protein
MSNTKERQPLQTTRRMALDVMVGTVGLVISMAGFFQQEVTFLFVGA